VASTAPAPIVALVAKPIAARVVAAAQPAPVAPADETAGAKIRAPLLGTFYSTPKPGEPAFVKVGDRVEPDTVVCIVEVMKLMNSVAAGITGSIAAIHVRDGDLVEHDQPMFTVVPA
jgi:acetyl-CoA carboxylase biotin carboxyl carrier protein